MRGAFLLAAPFLLCPATGQAAPVSAPTPATGNALIMLPSSFTKKMDMDFGLLTVTAAGAAILNSNTDAVTTTGGVLLAGGNPPSRLFSTQFRPRGNVVKITLPKKAVDPNSRRAARKR